MPTPHRRGFTLIELAIAVALAAFVTVALYQLFTVQSRQLAFLDLQSQMHQNLRFATDVLTRTIRIAGLGTNGQTTGYLGWDGSAASDAFSMPAVIAHDGMTSGTGTDAITVVHQDPSLQMPTDPDEQQLSSTTVLTFDTLDREGLYPTYLQNYSAGELMLCLDYANLAGMRSFLWVIQAVDPLTGTVTVESNCDKGYADYESAMPCTENLTAVLNCSKGQVVTFYIDNNAADGIGPGSVTHPVLMMDLDFEWPDADDVPLVDDIEDLQFAYCLQNQACDEEANWQQSLLLGEIPWMVRVSLISRSARPNLQETLRFSRPGLENHPADSVIDGYYRQVLTTEVTVRNLRYL